MLEIVAEIKNECRKSSAKSTAINSANTFRLLAMLPLLHVLVGKSGKSLIMNRQRDLHLSTPPTCGATTTRPSPEKIGKIEIVNRQLDGAATIQSCRESKKKRDNESTARSPTVPTCGATKDTREKPHSYDTNFQLKNKPAGCGFCTNVQTPNIFYRFSTTWF